MSPDLVVDTARGWLGTPYRHLSATKHAGCDCLGLIRGVWAELYGALPEVPNYRADARDHRDLLAAAEQRLALAEPGAGTIVIFRLGAAPRHCGIMTAPDRLIHAQERIGVVEANLTDGWARRVVGCFAFPETF
jgi:NlpC/P60 family putative phage cell wall peptidase